MLCPVFGILIPVLVSPYVVSVILKTPEFGGITIRTILKSMHTPHTQNHRHNTALEVTDTTTPELGRLFIGTNFKK
jgi:hypothetical protein